MTKKPFSPIPILDTARLRLRAIDLTDTDVLMTMRTDPQINKYIARALPQSTKEVQYYISERIDDHDQGKSITWALVIKQEKQDGQTIGTICLWNFDKAMTTADVGYEMLTSFHGQGYMGEALRAVVAYGKGPLGLASLLAFTHMENKSSRVLLERGGFLKQSQGEDKMVSYGKVLK